MMKEAPWLCRSCTAKNGVPFLYPSAADQRCATCNAPTDAQDALVAILITVQRVLADLPKRLTASDNPLCDVTEAARLYHTTEKGIRNLNSRAKMPPRVGGGGKLLWRRDDLLKYVSSRVSSPGGRNGR